MDITEFRDKVIIFTSEKNNWTVTFTADKIVEPTEGKPAWNGELHGTNTPFTVTMTSGDGSGILSTNGNNTGSGTISLKEPQAGLRTMERRPGDRPRSKRIQ